MAASFQFKTLQLENWRDCLRDINFWLDGYLSTEAYNILERNFDRFPLVQWNIGVGPTACFTRAISSIVRDRKIRLDGPFDHVIEMDMKQSATLSFKDMLNIKVAEMLGLLDLQAYKELKEEDDEVRYYSYGPSNATISLKELSISVVPRIIGKLSTKRYLLVVQNLHEPIKPIMLHAFTEEACLPPPTWNGSFWLVSTASQYVYNTSRPDYECTIDSFSGDDLLMLTLYSLHQAAKYILGRISNKDEKYWHMVALRCFHYAAMLLIPYCKLIDELPVPSSITSEELIRQWAAHGILPVIKETDQEYNDSDIYQIGYVILEAFQEYSLLQLPFTSPTIAEEGTNNTAAHILINTGLVAEHLTIGELSNDSHPGLERMQWILHVGDRGWHVSRDWLSHGANGPTTLIIRHCSEQSRLFANLDHLLAKLPCISVLDLSYTPLVSLPCSVCSLANLRLLSLRGCFNLSNPFTFLSNERTTLPGKYSNNDMIINWLCLDFSYSNVKSFERDFFHNMPNLQELMLTGCSNLVELPPSIAALRNLAMLELTGTEIKLFSVEIFAQMKKLRSLKLIDNKNLSLISEEHCKTSCDVIDQEVNRWDSIMEKEVKLERHPSLTYFSLIGTPHIKRLSLYGCRKLECVDIKELDSMEELNMSATAIKEVPVDICNLPRLRRLLLMDVACLRRFPWHQLRRLPDAFYLDQCTDGNSSIHCETQTAQVWISDSRLFCSFNSDTVGLVRSGKLLKSFYVAVTSCVARCREARDEDDTMLLSDTYADVNCCYLTEGVAIRQRDDIPPFQAAERHVEISAVDRYPHGLEYLLSVTKSMSMTDDTHISALDDLSDMDKLEECMLRRCHQMVNVFVKPYMRRALRNASVSHLKSLTHYFYRPLGGGVEFDALKHLRLEHCPRLVGVMPRGSALPNLVTLDILFCDNLKAVFYDNGPYSSRYWYELPCLRRMRLQELPQLQHLRDDHNAAILTAPAWEELHVRGCWSLRRLPRLRQRSSDKKAVEVSGERAWWANLRWDRDGSILHHGGYEPVLPPASASFRDRVVIKSYLR